MVDYIPFKSIDRYRYTGWWFGTGILCFSIQLGKMIPTDELIFFGGVGIPSTR